MQGLLYSFSRALSIPSFPVLGVEDAQPVQLLAHPAVGLFVWAAEVVEVNPPGEGGKGDGLPNLLHKLPHIVPGGQAQLAGKLPIDGVVHHHVDDGAAVVHHGQQFRLGLPGGVEAGHCPDQPGGLPYEETKANMKAVLRDIQDGTFAGKWIAENKNGRTFFNSKRALLAQHPMETVGAELRKNMLWGDDVDPDTASN